MDDNNPQPLPLEQMVATTGESIGASEPPVNNLAPTPAPAGVDDRAIKHLLIDLNEPAPEDEDPTVDSQQQVKQVDTTVEEPGGSTSARKREKREGEGGPNWVKRLKAFGNWVINNKVTPADKEASESTE